VRRKPLATRLHRWSLHRLGYGNGDPGKNGEYRLLDDLPAEPIVFDVGAHHGDYAAAVLERRPSAHVHCFEPGEETFRILAQKMDGRACLHNVALADSVGQRVLHSDFPGSAGASLFVRDLSWLENPFDREETVDVETVDSVCEAENIERIDMLKIDAEGADHLVLRGAARMIGEGRVGMVMFEYGGTALNSHFFIRDYYQLLDGFRLYRVLPDGLLPLGPYTELLEIAHYCNYCAIPAARLTR
jgi:FkbM family methyltransferase